MCSETTHQKPSSQVSCIFWC